MLKSSDHKHIDIPIKAVPAERNNTRLTVALFAAMCAVWLLSVILVCGKGSLHPESAGYLLHYTGPKTLL